MELVSVAAIADNLAIGKDGKIPWESLPEDKRQYRDRVRDAPVIMGRVTFESMLDDLPGRLQIVLSRSSRDYEVETAHHVTSVDEVIDLVHSLGDDTAYVLGGAAVYRLFQPRVGRMVLSRVPGEYEGDAFFPDWNPMDWRLVDETPFDGFTLEEWERVR